MADKIRDYFGDGQKWGVQIKYIHENSPLVQEEQLDYCQRMK